MIVQERSKFNPQQFQVEVADRLLHHPLHPGQVFSSPGGSFKYRVVGACCRLYDREQLPYPCCRLCWKGKEPFWNRIGRRFVADIGAKRSPSYCVQLVDYPEAEPFVMTLHWMKLTPEQQEWWYTKRLHHIDKGVKKLTESFLNYTVAA